MTTEQQKKEILALSHTIRQHTKSTITEYKAEGRSHNFSVSVTMSTYHKLLNEILNDEPNRHRWA